MDRQTQK